MPRRKHDSVSLWQQRWDKVLAGALDKKSAHQRSRHLALFLASTGKERLREIDAVDLHDFLIVWGRTHTPGSTARIKTEIAGFWRWLREQNSLDLPRIAGQPPKWELTPVQARAILKGCEADYRVAQWLDGVLVCETRAVGMSYNRLRRRFRRVATDAGVGWMTPSRFRHELRRRKWGRELIAEHLAARAASPLKAEAYSSLPMVQMAFRFTDTPNSAYSAH